MNGLQTRNLKHQLLAVTVRVNPSPPQAAWYVFRQHHGMLTNHTRLTGIRGAGVPRWILLQHSVGYQTTGHQRRGTITFNPLQAPGYPLLSVPHERKGLKVSRCSAQLFLFDNIKMCLCLRYLFISKSFVTAPSKYFFNSDTENDNRKCPVNLSENSTNLGFIPSYVCVIRSHL